MIIEGPDGKGRNTHRGMDEEQKLVEVEFRNISVTVANVKDAQEAYTYLCEALASMEDSGLLVEWTTDTYVVLHRSASEWSEERPTSDLFPKMDES